MLEFPEQFVDDIPKQSWLDLLLTAYTIIDHAVAKAIIREEKQGHILACHKGCSACCKTHKDIPFYPLELVGIT